MLQCFVVGPSEGGKSSLLEALSGTSGGSGARARTPLAASHLSGVARPADRFAAALVDAEGGRYTLVLRELCEASEQALAESGVLAYADALAIVYDDHSQASLQQAARQLVALAEVCGGPKNVCAQSQHAQNLSLVCSQGNAALPVALIATSFGPGSEINDGLRSAASAICASLCIPPPLRVATKDMTEAAEVFSALVTTALSPEGRVPETAAHRAARARARMLRQTLGYAAAGTTVICIAVAAYRYTRRGSSASSSVNTQ